MNELDSKANSSKPIDSLNYETVKWHSNERLNRFTTKSATLGAGGCAFTGNLLSLLNLGQSLFIAAGATLVMARH